MSRKNEESEKALSEKRKRIKTGMWIAAGVFLAGCVWFCFSYKHQVCDRRPEPLTQEKTEELEREFMVGYDTRSK